MTNVMLAGMIGGWELVLILAAFLIFFGAKRLPELAKGMGQCIKEFKKATREVTDELSTAMDDSSPPKRLPTSSVQTQPESQPTTSATVAQSAPSSPKA
jgi:sec-independent protein translocase protein TatA